MWLILMPIIIIAYFLLMYFWMQYTFKYEHTLNYYAFKRELESNRKSFMHYVELAATILLLVAILTTMISQIQIWFSKRRK